MKTRQIPVAKACRARVRIVCPPPGGVSHTRRIPARNRQPPVLTLSGSLLLRFGGCMQRSFIGVLVSSLAVIAALGGLSFISAAPSSHKAPPPPEGDWRILDPVTYENISLFPVVGGSQDTSSFLTLEEGLASGEVLVTERGAERLIRDRGQVRPAPQYNTGASVNQLVLINRSKRPLLLLAGELVSGGKQDRIIGKDRIVPAGAPPLPLDVFCVEHGRWTGGSQFAAAKTIVHPSVRERAAVDQAQTKVWDSVRNGTNLKGAPTAAAPAPKISAQSLETAIASSARTEAYEKIYESRGVAVSIESFVDEVQRRFAHAASGLKGERVVGVVVAYGGEVAWSDIFASGDL